jgi:hypothetical protein
LRGCTLGADGTITYTVIEPMSVLWDFLHAAGDPRCQQLLADMDAAVATQSEDDPGRMRTAVQQTVNDFCQPGQTPANAAEEQGG